VQTFPSGIIYLTAAECGPYPKKKTGSGSPLPAHKKTCWKA